MESQHAIRRGGSRITYAFHGCQRAADQLRAQEETRRHGVLADRITGLRLLSGIPERFQDVTFETCLRYPAAHLLVQYAARLVEQFDERSKTGYSLLLTGPTGSGKTLVGCALLNALILRGTAVRYLYAPDFLGLLRHHSDVEASLIEITFRELASVPCLFLDEIGLDKDTPFTEATYVRVIDSRSRSNRPTVYASNLGLADLERTISPRGLSRLLEFSDVVQADGPDYRLESH